MQYDFPAVFYPDDKSVACRFYDCEDWFSCGDDIADAIEMAEDVLCGRLMRLERDGGKIPTPTKLDNVILLPNQVVRMIHADTEKYARELAAMNDRQAIENADNPIRELRERQGLTIKELSDILHAPYRTVQDWNAGKSKPPEWVVPLIIDRVLNDR